VPQGPRGPRLVLPRRLEIDPIITMTSEGVIQSASESVEKVFGWTPMELFGRNVKLLIPEPRRSALDRYLDRYRHSDRTKALQRTRLFDAVRKDGTVVHIELSVSRADLPSHAEPYFIGIIRDVSKDIEVGRESADVRSRLQELVTEQTRALATANLRLQLSDRLASLGTLAAGLGHDMHNMLLPIRARLNALEHAGISGPALAHVAAVRRSIAYLQHLSEGLHFLAADPDGPGVSIDGVGTTDLAHWWSQVGELLCKAIPARVKVKASIPAGMPEVKTAPHWLTQAVLNLLVNAAESMPPGRRDPLVKVWATASDDGRTVRLGVTDNGRGMTREVQRRAFDLFFTTKARGMSTGLGLPLVRKVAVRAGGLVDLSSSPGRGTTVVLTLPTTRRTAPRAAPPRARRRPARESRWPWSRSAITAPWPSSPRCCKAEASACARTRQTNPATRTSGSRRRPAMRWQRPSDGSRSGRHGALCCSAPRRRRRNPDGQHSEPPSSHLRTTSWRSGVRWAKPWKDCGAALQ
jgi:PAS domain S-box-containing protein